MNSSPNSLLTTMFCLLAGLPFSWLATNLASQQKPRRELYFDQFDHRCRTVRGIGHYFSHAFFGHYFNGSWPPAIAVLNFSNFNAVRSKSFVLSSRAKTGSKMVGSWDLFFEGREIFLMLEKARKKYYDQESIDLYRNPAKIMSEKWVAKIMSYPSYQSYIIFSIKFSAAR